MEDKSCTLCLQSKPYIQFYVSNLSNCKECLKEKRRAHYTKNKKLQIEQSKAWIKANPKKQNNYTKKYITTRLKTDLIFRLIFNLRRRTRSALKSKKFTKTSKMSQYLGCTSNYLKSFIESQFKPGMNWDNHGINGWHIDHIVPLANVKTKEELYKLCHYTNLQPLWAIENLKKSNKSITLNK